VTVKIRWVTWWPVPYWTDRFDVLAARTGVDLEVLFLTERSAILPTSVRSELWQFKYRFLASGADDSGYYRRVVRLRDPAPLFRGEFDALIMTYADPTCIAAAAACRALGKPFYFFCANTDDDARSSNPTLEWFKRRLIGMAAGVLATGPAQRQYIERYAASRTPVWEIGNPVKRLGADQYLTKRDELRRTMGFQSGCPVVLFVGRLSPEKGLGTLIKATAICKARGLPAKLVLVGSGPEEDALRDLGQTTDMDVEFHGFLEGHALAERYAAADVFVLPSNSEPWGLVVNEAMEFGLPLLLSNRVGSRAVLLEEGNNGFTFPAGDENALADALEPLLARPEIQKEMGQASRLIIENCTIDQWADAVVRAVSPRPSQP